MTNPIQTDEFKAAVAAYIRDNLRIKVTTTSEYTGGMDGGSLYSDRHTVQLLLDGDIISEASL